MILAQNVCIKLKSKVRFINPTGHFGQIGPGVSEEINRCCADGHTAGEEQRD